MRQEETTNDVQLKQKAFKDFLARQAKEVQEDPHVNACWAFLIPLPQELDKNDPEPAWQHALSVAQIVSEQVGLGPHSLAAALLHEWVVQGEIRIDDLNQWLHPVVIRLLTGLRKVAAIRTDRTAYHSENFIKLLLTVGEDVRVTLIRLADRLHHLRKADHLPPHEQNLLATECAHLYAPVAHRLGLYKIKTELEELSMRILEPAVFESLQKKVAQSASKQKVLIEDFTRPIEKALLKHGFDFEIKWRTKSIPSIWRKMKVQGVDYEQVYDVFAIRVILNQTIESEKADAWKVYSLITDIYPPNPERLRDWITTPKASGYESLHTTVFGPGKRWFEVQIRSRRMDDVAEKGHAAHWSYKDAAADVSSTAWLNQIRSLLEHQVAEAFEKAHQAKTDLYSDKIFIFTPDGDLRKLPAGSSVLDFAYEIHTRIGNTCTGAKVNGKNVTLKHKLENGDNVAILTSKNQQPKSDWLGYVVSTKAKSRIKRALKEDLLKEVALGKEIVERKFRNWKIPFSDEVINKVIRHFHFRDSLEFYAAVSAGRFDLLDAKEILKEENNSTHEKQPITAPQSLQPSRLSETETVDILEIDDSLDHVNYNLAPCCNPIFGDDVFGFVTVSKGISVHRLNCPNAADLLNRYPYRIVEVKWRKSSGLSSYQATIKVSGTDELGMVNQISEVISQDMKVNMRSLSFETNGSRFEGSITLNVHDTQHLEALIRKIQKVKGVLRVVRGD
ncbi:MAG TPA: RelA/SpoT family protein [Bacteroidales bacterium]|nr:RelA/SpoT family protein [Bacteroidales bacterium]